MKWLKRLFAASATHNVVVSAPKPTTPSGRPNRQGIPATVRIVQFGTCDFDVVGESSYQDALAAIAGPAPDDGHEAPVTVWLICQDQNPHDRNAVAVVVQEKIVGYLSRADAREYRKSLREETGSLPSAMTAGLIVGGGIKRKTGERMHLGIRIDLAIPVEIE